MSRTVAGVDRLLVLLVGLGLVAAGVAAVVWQRGLVSSAAGPLRTAGLTSAADASWWPWAVGAAGVVLVVLGLRWLLAHVFRTKVGRTRLAGSDASGRLTVDLSVVAAAAATSLEDTLGVRSTSGRTVDERGRRTLALTLTVDPGANLATVVAAAERACADLGRAVGEEELAARVHVHVGR